MGRNDADLVLLRQRRIPGNQAGLFIGQTEISITGSARLFLPTYRKCYKLKEIGVRRDLGNQANRPFNVNMYNAKCILSPA